MNSNLLARSINIALIGIILAACSNSGSQAGLTKRESNLRQRNFFVTSSQTQASPAYSTLGYVGCHIIENSVGRVETGIAAGDCNVEVDRDNDGIADAADLCPDTISSNIDSDGDANGNECDNCPYTYNQGWADGDSDGIGDACDPDLMDSDGDGYSASNGECNDLNSSINPGALDIPADGVDQNCDGVDASNPDPDNDGDGFAQSNDCEDYNVSIHPGSEELEDGMDNNCNGLVDEGIVPQDLDHDGDGFPASKDCDDTNAAINPNANEIGNGVDDNCNGLVDEPWFDTVIGRGTDVDSCQGAIALAEADFSNNYFATQAKCISEGGALDTVEGLLIPPFGCSQVVGSYLYQIGHRVICRFQ